MNVLIVPQKSNKLLPIKLPRPKDNNAQSFLYDEDNLILYEIVRYHDQFRSWFFDNSFCKEGHFDLITRVDPLFLFLPHIIKHSSEHYRTLHDICSTVNSEAQDGISKIDHALAPDINWNHICDTKELDDDLYVKFCQSKTLNWLSAKHHKTVAALLNAITGQPSKATLISYAIDLIDEYLPQSLSDKFKETIKGNRLDEVDVPKKAEVPPTKISSKRTNQQTPPRPAKGSIDFYFRPK